MAKRISAPSVHLGDRVGPWVGVYEQDPSDGGYNSVQVQGHGSIHVVLWTRQRFDRVSEKSADTRWGLTPDDAIELANRMIDAALAAKNPKEPEEEY